MENRFPKAQSCTDQQLESRLLRPGATVSGGAVEECGVRRRVFEGSWSSDSCLRRGVSC